MAYGTRARKLLETAQWWTIAASLAATPALGHDGHVHLVVSAADAPVTSGPRTWLAGDHHIHSEFSAGYEADPANPAAIPKPLFGRDGRYPIQKNAEMARAFGLAWMVSTDHGGPNHSQINHDIAYPELEKSRRAVPQVLQFFGMEFDTPAGDHSSLIIPRSAAEREQLREIEAGYSQHEAHPRDPARDRPERMIAALSAMKAQARPPVLIANHPSRSASATGAYGRYDPAEFRNWNDTAPNVAVGMEGAPGHQASALKADGSINPAGQRGGYRAVPTMGGFDPMTARLGGFWDSMLGEGRRWWITATSDSHRNWREGGHDFWPGEYSKTYVLARRDYADILDGLRHGRVFVATGNLVETVNVTLSAARSRAPTAGIGGTLRVRTGEDVLVEVRVRAPRPPVGGRAPLARVDLISGAVMGPAADRATDRNPTTQVVRRFAASQWQRRGEEWVMRHRIRNVRAPLYLRVRGTNTPELEPLADPPGEDPWSACGSTRTPRSSRSEASRRCSRN